MTAKTMKLNGEVYHLATMGMSRRDAAQIARNLRSHGYKVRTGNEK